MEIESRVCSTISEGGEAVLLISTAAVIACTGCTQVRTYKHLITYGEWAEGARFFLNGYWERGMVEAVDNYTLFLQEWLWLNSVRHKEKTRRHKSSMETF